MYLELQEQLVLVVYTQDQIDVDVVSNWTTSVLIGELVWRYGVQGTGGIGNNSTT